MGQVSSARARDDAFGEDGFVHMSGFFSPRQIAEVLANIDRYIREVVPAAPATDVFYEDKARPETLKQLIRLHARDAFFRRLLEEGSLREAAARLLGEAVRPINQQVFIKPPGGDSRPTPHAPKMSSGSERWRVRGVWFCDGGGFYFTRMASTSTSNRASPRRCGWRWTMSMPRTAACAMCAARTGAAYARTGGPRRSAFPRA